jgi:hypothetical protein
LPAGVSLRQREWDHADGQKQKHVKGTSNKMSFDGGIDLLFHSGLGFFLFKSWVSCFPQKKLHFGGRTSFLRRNAKECQYFFLKHFFYPDSGRCSRDRRSRPASPPPGTDLTADYADDTNFSQTNRHVEKKKRSTPDVQR